MKKVRIIILASLFNILYLIDPHKTWWWSIILLLINFSTFYKLSDLEYAKITVLAIASFLSLYVYIFKLPIDTAQYYSITWLAIAAFNISFLSYKLVEYFEIREKGFFKKWGNNYLVVFLAALLGILVSFEIERIKQRQHEELEQIRRLDNDHKQYNEKLIALYIETFNNQSKIERLIKSLPKKNVNVMRMPNEKLDSTFTELILKDSDTTKYLDEQTIAAMYSYMNSINDFNRYTDALSKTKTLEQADLNEFTTLLSYSKKSMATYREIILYLFKKYGVDRKINLRDIQIDQYVQEQKKIDREYCPE